MSDWIENMGLTVDVAEELVREYYKKEEEHEKSMRLVRERTKKRGREYEITPILVYYKWFQWVSREGKVSKGVIKIHPGVCRELEEFIREEKIESSVKSGKLLGDFLRG